MEIVNTTQLEDYLTKTNLPFTSLQLLEGGSANFVWRLVDVSGKTIIIKHAEPYVAASASRMPFPVDRMDFEHRALTVLPGLIDENKVVSVPAVYQYDDKNHVLQLEDGGPRTLKEAYMDPSIDIKCFGRNLGIWLAGLHQKTQTTDIGDNKTAKSIYRFAYSHSAAALAKYGFDPSLGERINQEYGSLLSTDNECVCHGDFWPGNVLVNEQSLTVVDWEMVRRGCGATDVGQFAAEASLLDRFRGGRGLMGAFLAGHQETCKMTAQFMQRASIQMGAHLAFWPTRVAWGTDEETRECVRTGVGVMTRALAGEVKWFEDVSLEELVGQERCQAVNGSG